MIKGWRNNPQWVDYYNKKHDAKIQRQADRMRAEVQIQQMMMTSTEAIRSLQRRPYVGMEA